MLEAGLDFGDNALIFVGACCVTTFNVLKFGNMLLFRNILSVSDCRVSGDGEAWKADPWMDWVVLMSSYRVVTLANSEEHHNGNCITEFLMKVCFYSNDVNQAA